MGDVSLAEDTRLERRVAITFLHPQRTRPRGARASSARTGLWESVASVGIRPGLPTREGRCYAAEMARYRIKATRRLVAREAAVAYKPPVIHPLQAPGVYHVTVTDRGRIVLPAEIRKRLKIRDGDRVAVSIEDDGSVSVTTRTVALDHLQGMFKHLAPKDHFASDDLIAERRREARRDDRRHQEWVTSQRRKQQR